MRTNHPLPPSHKSPKQPLRIYLFGNISRIEHSFLKQPLNVNERFEKYCPSVRNVKILKMKIVANVEEEGSRVEC